MVIRLRELAVHQNCMIALKNVQAPAALTELCSFLELCKFYHRFRPDFASVLGCLTLFSIHNKEKIEDHSEMKNLYFQLPSREADKLHVLALRRHEGRYA
jgi:hypothetical protein